MLLYEPSKHGSAAEEPSAQNEPAMHVLHAVSPAPSWKVPLAHLSHEPWPFCGWIVPGLHSTGVAAPVEQKEPSVHSRQSVSAVITVSDSS